MPGSTGKGPGQQPPREEIDYEQLGRELLDRAEQLVEDWLPNGTRDGDEYKAAPTRKGGPGDSWVVNLRTGWWGHFAGDEKGRDLISLYAALHRLEQWEAARKLIDDLSLQGCIKRVAGGPRASDRSPAAAPAPPGKPAPAKRTGPTEKGEFMPIVPVPAHAGPPPKEHRFRGVPDRVWKYERDGQLLGYVYRFTDSEGDKVITPVVWGQSRMDGSQKWIWKHWDAPKPLYLPAGRLRPGTPAVIVEGEKCADALHQLVGEEFDVLSWPGGTKAVDRAAWDWLLPSAADAQPRRFILWPDADFKRRLPSAAEKAAGIEKNDPRLDYLPARKQPGLSAMEKIAQILHAQQEPRIWMIRPPDPPAKPQDAPPLADGWDCADAIAEGWDAEKIKAHLRQATKWEAIAHQGDDAQGSAGASGGSATDPEDPKAWRLGLLRSPETGAIKAARENVVLALQSLPQTRAKIAFNEFTNDVVKLADMPWGSAAGKWSEVDELLMGEWLCRSHYLPSMPRTTLEEGMRMVATRHQYHPVREYLGRLRWDGTPRLNDWLILAAVGEPDKLRKRERAYLQRVSAWFLMGMVARAMRPGCKFDYMPILEGPQGMRKSTVLNVLAGDWFADTGFVLGDKDSLQMLQGRWLYEISELDAMARAEVTKIKAFVASKTDWYRASFDKRPREYPRQLVFAGTTNEHQYLVDGTGNRRFWPVDVTRVIDTDYVASVRDQLFAEAWQRVQQGERYFPNQREELELFLPQQKARMVESPIEVRILDYLVNHADGRLQASVQIVNLLTAIGIDITKLGPGRFHEKQAGTALRKFGWERTRASAKVPGRPWIYVRPSNWPACMDLDELDEPPGTAPAPAKANPPAVPAMAAEPADYDDGGAPAAPSIPFDESDSNEPF